MDGFDVLVMMTLQSTPGSPVHLYCLGSLFDRQEWNNSDALSYLVHWACGFRKRKKKQQPREETDSTFV